ncbi:MAG: hypothetical protein Q4D98_07865 [Planctomycetia bacterium]|nr:hypothetical protein [Planctomycetia bacterium]
MRTSLIVFFGICMAAILAGCKEQSLGPYSQGRYDLARPHMAAVQGPGPGVVQGEPNQAADPGAASQPSAMKTSQIAFVGPSGATVRWDVSAQSMFDSEPLVCPGRQNFPQGGIYRLKLTDIPGHPGLELYPTLEVAPAMPRTQAFLAHSMIPVNFTEEDIMQVRSGNFVTKVIYLPDPEFQELALAVGTPDTIVSTRLDPGVDPIAEADRRGAILAIMRLGNKMIDPEDEMQNTMVDGSVPGATAAPMVGSTPSNYISGVNAPEYGTPITETPQGYPGPVSLPMTASPVEVAPAAGSNSILVDETAPVAAPTGRNYPHR